MLCGIKNAILVVVLIALTTVVGVVVQRLVVDVCHELPSALLATECRWSHAMQTSY
jgi:hypothetical protein